MKTSLFIFFAESILRQQKEALRALECGDINTAAESLNCMERVLEETLDGFKIERKAKDELAKEAAEMILANDLPRTVQIKMSESVEFISSASKTIRDLI